jgi:hypothetical protein
VSSYEQEARLSALGRGAVRGRLTQFLVNRLKLHDWLFRQPEILEEAIERPIFILGLPRTGTTLLHDLLALDPLSRAPLHWEAEEPCPPPQLFHSVTDPRIQTAHAKLRALDAMAPEMKVIHPMAAGAPTECMTLLIHEFKSLEFECQAWVPTYGAWFTHCDKASAYRTHRKLLQLLQWRSPNETWVLKAPTHLFGLDALLAEYPDAQVIFTHRDPLKVVASQASLIAVASGLLSDEVDPHRSASWWSAKTATGLEKATKLRDRMGPEAFFDLQYHELVRDPVGAVRRAYAHFGREVTPVHERRMRSTGGTATPSSSSVSTRSRRGGASAPIASASASRRRAERRGRSPSREDGSGSKRGSEHRCDDDDIAMGPRRSRARRAAFAPDRRGGSAAVQSLSRARLCPDHVAGGARGFRQ